jgi:hypothetical protein
MILAPTLTLNTLARGYDADATAFAAASGATDVAALSAFVKGVKELGLWSNMVCWPLRSTQNAGTGTTAYSLGGLGTFNGTLTNGPSWGADGVSFTNASAQYINTSLSYDPSTLVTGLFTIVKPVGTYPTGVRAICGNRAGSAATMLIKVEGGQQQIYLFDTAGGHNAAVAASAISSTFANTFHFAGGLLNSTSRLIFNQANSTTNSSTSVGGTVGSGDNTFQIGAQGSNIDPWEGLIAFCGVIRASSFTSSNLEALRSLVNSTLGTGLGLP